MKELLGRFSSLSLVGKVVVLVAIGLVIAPLAYIFRGGMALWVVLGGLLMVILLLAGFQAILAARARKQASPFERALSGASAATPMGISEPARRARLDDLRKSFESGLDKFKASGKSLYSLPWYLVVGEPGSGKTEAIRHCNVGFPPGLQDELQGSGGTLNMNWWFTNHAVIIDTAGRLMFEEVEPGTTSEWIEFLNLLRKHRGNCPINGMLLVVPSESLITDSADAIQAKASRIAKQLDTVQRTLGVRFPVFVVVTKADLINGFREFFDTIKEPQLQHQMLGWSNPDDLDTPFDPDKVDQYLEEVGDRLSRRRTTLLLDPIHTDDQRGRRTDQVDALFAFPESMHKLGPRLRQYLSTIFVQGEWSAKPLFLRGIYFTSSMREGSALDADLAEALGLPVGQLPEGKVWERDRAFFLRDLFMNKVFRERGLVTRVLNTARLRRARAIALLGTAAAGLGFLAVLTWFGARSLTESIIKPLDFWASTAKAYREREDLVDQEVAADRHMMPVVNKHLDGDDFFYYFGDAEPLEEQGQGDSQGGTESEPRSNRLGLRQVPVDAARQRVALFPGVLREASERQIKVPLVFSPVAAVTGDDPSNLLASQRAEAARALIRSSIAAPLFDATRTRIRTSISDDTLEETVHWSPQATAALEELIRLYAFSPDPAVSSPLPKAEPLLRYALSGTTDPNVAAVEQDVEAIDSAMKWLFDHPDPAAVNAGLRRSKDIEFIETGLDVFLRAAKRPEIVSGTPSGSASSADSTGGAATTLLAHLRTFDSSLTAIRALAEDQSPLDSGSPVASWSKASAQARDAADAAATLAPSLSQPLADAVAGELERAGSSFEREAARLMSALEQAALRAGEPGSAITGKFLTLKQNLERGVAEVRSTRQSSAQAAPSDAPALERRYLSGDPSGLELARALLAALDERVRASVDPSAAPADPAAAQRAQARISELSGKAMSAQNALAARSPNNPFVAAAAQLVARLDASDRRLLASATLAEAPASASAIATSVAERAEKANADRPTFPPMPMAAQTAVGAPFDPRFHPAAAVEVLRPVFELRGVRPDDEQSAQKRGIALAAASEYLSWYLDYWSRGVLEQATPGSASSWIDTHRAASAAPDAWMHHGPLKTLVAASRQAAVSARESLDGVASEEQLSALQRLERAADKALKTIDEAGVERSVQSRLGAWRGLGADPAAAAASIRGALADPSRAADWFLTIPGGGAGDGSDLALAYWRQLFLSMATSLRQSATPESVAYFKLVDEITFPLCPPAQTASRGELTRDDLARLHTNFEALAQSPAGSDQLAAGRFSPDPLIDAQASALAGSAPICHAEQARVVGLQSFSKWLTAGGSGPQLSVIPAGAVRIVASGAAGANASAQSGEFVARVSPADGVLRVLVIGADGQTLGDRSFVGAWPTLRVLAEAKDVAPVEGSTSTWQGSVEVSLLSGDRAIVPLRVVLPDAPVRPPVLSPAP